MTDTEPIDFSRLAPPAGSRIAIVGGCGGIGRALVSACRGLRLKPAVPDLPQALEHQAATSDNVIGIPLDATSEQAVNQSFDELGGRWGSLDVLVFVTGIAVIPPRSIEELTVAQWEEVMHVNLRAAWFCVR